MEAPSMAAAEASLVQVSRCTPRSPMMSSASTRFEQVRHRRALIAADVTHAGLQQSLGHREDTLAAEGLALAERERLHLFLEGAFHRRYPTYPRRDARHPGTAGSSFPSPCASGESVPSGGLFDRDIRLANDAAIFLDLPPQVSTEFRAAHPDRKESLLGKLRFHVGGLERAAEQAG